MKLSRTPALILLLLLPLIAVSFAADGSMLKPPKKDAVSIQVFEDLECPACRVVYPAIWDVAKTHHIPVVLHDFPLPQHPWAKPAAVWARYFDTKSEKLGNDFRAYIYQNQPQIDVTNLLQYVQKFGDENKVSIPLAPDPHRALQDKIDADAALGTKAHLEHTPTIFIIVSTGAGQAPRYVEVAEIAKLTQMVEDVQRKIPPATKH